MNILEEAANIVAGSRQTDYGHPIENHRRTAAFWSEYILAKHGVFVPLTERDVCWLNVMQKIARDCNAPKRDNLVDVVGYTRNIEQIGEELGEVPFA